eukprot:TRINITY_DN25556_c0_g1_i1.p1 TRINITY_DN25556_c0_g1~~TRINITY_DN25556_c0_g1_i1.p1  ORF type:complete len:518 (-),score=91.13 TRINITY_DN25556_c0_g1_i1:201-1754(-)
MRQYPSNSMMTKFYNHLFPGTLLGFLPLLLPLFQSSLFASLGNTMPSIFSEWNAPKARHPYLLDAVSKYRLTEKEPFDLWSPLPDQGWKPCSEKYIPLHNENSQGFIQVFLEGGLNQQRMGICDAVAVAKILNATLVVPHFDTNPVWQDSSSFAEIFDVDHFVETLKHDVAIVKELPKEFRWSTRFYYATGIRATRIKSAPVQASIAWYLENVLPVLKSYGIVAIAPFAHRLAFDNIPAEIQRLRCKVNFQALRFIPPIYDLGEALVRRLRSPLENNLEGQQINSYDAGYKGSGKFVVLHLRFDKDMAAHSSCDFGGGKAERLALAKYRQILWQGRVMNSQFSDEELRSQGRCPLTPEEIGLLLAAFGFSNRTRLYLASHKVYGGEARISILRQLFPLMENKKSLATEEELKFLDGKASISAAVDYHVSMQSDIFISASPGNMHNAMAAHRSYEYHKKTIRPNMILLGQLFLNQSIEWKDFEAKVRAGHKQRQGQIRLRKSKQSIYTYPAPDCMCQA